MCVYLTRDQDDSLEEEKEVDNEDIVAVPVSVVSEQSHTKKK